MRSVLITLAAALTAPIVAALPHSDGPSIDKDILSRRGSQSGLAARADIPKEEQIGHLVTSHGCFSTGGGFPQCRDLILMSWGEDGDYGDCNTPSVNSAFEDPCEIKGSDEVKIDTPMGEGLFQPDSNCGNDGKQGTIITAMDDTSVSGYECVKDDHQFTTWCGFSWSNNAVMKCTYKGEFE